MKRLNLPKINFKNRSLLENKNKIVIVVLIIGVLLGFFFTIFSLKKKEELPPVVIKEESQNQNLFKPVPTNFPNLPPVLPKDQNLFVSLPKDQLSGDNNLKPTPTNFPKLPIPNIPNNIPKPTMPGARQTQAVLGVTAILDDRIAILTDGSVIEAGSQTKWGTVTNVDSNGATIGDKYVALDRSMQAVDSISFNTDKNNFSPQTTYPELSPKEEKPKEEQPAEKDGITIQEITVQEVSIDNNKTKFGGQK